MIKVILKYKNYNQLLSLSNKITVVTGNSATGKSSIGKLSNPKVAQFVDIKISDKEYDLVYVDNGKLFDTLDFKSKNIFVIDEGVKITDTRASKIRNSIGCYFLIITRHNVGICELNYDIFDVKELVEVEKDKVVLQNFVYGTHSVDDMRLTSNDYVIVEDSKKGYKWFCKLFNKVNTNMIIAGESLMSQDSNYTPGGKEKVCQEAKYKLDTINGKVLLVFDRCSFGSQVFKLMALLQKDNYYKRIRIIPNYLSWEYLMLSSNMFKKYFVRYNINIPMFEEKYYEIHLEDLSMRYGINTIKHDPKTDMAKRLSQCYYEKCCCVNKDKKCYIGVSGDDKFKAMLIGTEFEGLIELSGR